MASLQLTRDTYAPGTTGGPITTTRRRARRVSSPRERTLTELFGLSFSLEQMITDESDFLSAYINADDEPTVLKDCGD